MTESPTPSTDTLHELIRQGWLLLFVVGLSADRRRQFYRGMNGMPVRFVPASGVVVGQYADHGKRQPQHARRRRQTLCTAGTP